MCGIAGAIRRDFHRSPWSFPLRRRSGGALGAADDATHSATAGRTAVGLWDRPGREVVLGHRRLAIIDLSEAGAQPMVDQESGLAVTSTARSTTSPRSVESSKRLATPFDRAPTRRSS